MPTKLPYTKTTTFSHGGQTYTDEKDAVRAAVAAIVGNTGVANTIVSASCELAPLLARACELGMGTAPPVRSKDE